MPPGHPLDTPFIRRADNADLGRWLAPPADDRLPAATPRSRRRPRPYQTRRVRGLIPAEPPPPDTRYSLVASRVQGDHALSDGAKATFARLAGLAGRAGRLDTWVRSLATLAARHIRTVQRHLKALEERGHIRRLRDPATGRLHVLIEAASTPPPPRPPQAELLHRALRSKHPTVLDVAQACVRRLTATLRQCGQGTAGVTFVSPIKGSTISEVPAAGGQGRNPTSQRSHASNPKPPIRP